MVEQIKNAKMLRYYNIYHLSNFSYVKSNLIIYLTYESFVKKLILTAYNLKLLI